MYVTYGMVVSAVLWGKSRRMDRRDTEERKQVSRPLCWAALLWIVVITGLLVYMTFASISHTALLETIGGMILVVTLGYIYYRVQRKGQLGATSAIQNAPAAPHE